MKRITVGLKRVGDSYKIARITNAITIEGRRVGDRITAELAQFLCDSPLYTINVSENT